MSKSITELEAEFFSKPAQIATVNVPAGTTVPVNAYGASYAVVSATGNTAVFISTNRSGEVPMAVGTSNVFPKYFRFETLQLRNPNAYDIVVVLWYGFGEYKPNNFFLTTAPTFPLSVVSTQIAGADGVALTGAPPANAIRRRSVVVSNLDPSNPLEIYDKAPGSGGVSLLVVFAKTVIEFESDAPLYIANATGSAIQCRITEVWYKL